MYSTILVPIDDGAAVANRAFEHVRLYGATVHLRSVTDTEAEPPGHDRPDRPDVRQTLAEWG